MDDSASVNVAKKLETRKASKVPLIVVLGLVGAAMIAWSVVLPVLGIVYLVQLFS